MKTTSGHIRFAASARIARRALLASVLTTLLAPAVATAGGVTNLHDDARTGWYPDQPSLTTSAVTSSNFGQVFSTQLDGQVFAQPLLSNNTVFATTENNTAYGLDPVDGHIRWTNHFGVPFNPGYAGCGDLTPTVGSTSTPVIDPAGSGTAYMTTKVGDSDPTYSNGTWLLHAVDVTSGVEKSGFPVVIGGAADNLPDVSFDGLWELQRPGILLQDGAVYLGFGGHCDNGPYRGWIFRVTTAGQTTARWVDVPSDVRGGGIWQAGAGLASDGPGSLLFATGNGFGDNATPGPLGQIPGSTPPGGLSESIVRLSLQADGTLAASDFFTPSLADQLDNSDADFASGGPVVLPNSFGTLKAPKLLSVVGKEGIVYTLDRDSLGGFAMGLGGTDQAVDKGPTRAGVWGKPSIFGGDGGWMYVVTSNGLDSYRRQVDSTGIPHMGFCATTNGPVGLGSSPAVVTSNSAKAGSALVWVLTMGYRDGWGTELRVYDGSPICGRDMQPLKSWAVGQGTRYSPPGVGDGRIYVGNLEGKVIGFGTPAPVTLGIDSSSIGVTTAGHALKGSVTLRAYRDGITVRSLGLDSAAGFTLDTPKPVLPLTLNAGDTLSVPISFTSSAVGNRGANLRVTTPDGVSTFAITARNRAIGPYLGVVSKLMEFGPVVVNGTARASVTLSNQGSEPLTVSKVQLPSGFMKLGFNAAAPFTIPVDGSRTLELLWTPRKVGSLTGKIAFTTNGNEATTARLLSVTGSAAVAGRLSLSQTGVAFGRVKRGASVRKTVAFKNTGGVPITLTKFKQPASGGFSVGSSLNEGSRILPGKTITLSVYFAPTEVGSASAQLYITANDGLGPRVISLSGTGS